MIEWSRTKIFLEGAHRQAYASNPPIVYDTLYMVEVPREECFVYILKGVTDILGEFPTLEDAKAAAELLV